jgi:hypothetical protein
MRRKQYLRRWCTFLTVVSLLFVLPAANAVTISGIMIYSTDDFGNPNGVNTQITDQFDAQMWRTLVRPSEQWYGLAVTQGLPPRSVDAPFLNTPNFAVDLNLDEGENYFTLFGEPGPLTATDDYQRFAVNLYFDGDETNPGISVLFPRFADLEGGTVSESRANDDDVYSLTLQKVPVAPKSYYDDGVYRVSVLEASFLPPERANLSVDRIAAQSMTSGGTSDWVGTLTVLVEPSESFAGVGPGVPAAGRGGGGGAVGTTDSARGAGGPVFVPPGMLGAPGGVEPPAAFEDDSRQPQEDSAFWQEGDKPQTEDEEEPEGTPTPEDLVDALERWLAEANEATPGATEDVDTESTPEVTPETTQTALPTTPTPRPRDTATAGSAEIGSPTAASTETPATAPTPTPASSGDVGK